jgi:hypothetical protein
MTFEAVFSLTVFGLGVSRSLCGVESGDDT